MTWIWLGCAGAGAPGGAQPATPAARGEAPSDSGSSEPSDSPFPSQDELDALARQPAPLQVPPEAFVEPDSWKLAGPLPDSFGEVPIDSPDPFEQILVDLAARRAGLVVVSEGMRCVAREIGTFFVEKGALPSRPLQEFMLGRCGVSGVNLGLGYVQNRVPADASPERVSEVWGPELQKLVYEHLGTGPRAVGMWFGRRGEDAVALLASARRKVLVEPGSTTPDAEGRIRVAGELLTPADALFASVNRGDTGYAACEAAPGVRLPRFELLCTVDPGDEYAWLTVSVRRSGHLLSEGALMVLARPRAGAADVWTRPSYGAPLEVSDEDAFRAAVLERLNVLRSRAGSPPLVLEKQESLTARRLAPYYFASVFGPAGRGYGDVVALGLMAGWEVGGVVRNAAVGGEIAVATLDVDRWIAQALTWPGLRSLLLDPANTRLALGPLFSTDAPRYLAAVVASYELYRPRDPGAWRQDLYGRLDREFDARGKVFPQRERATEAAAAREAERVHRGALSPRAALDVLMQEMSARLGVSVRGWVLEGTSVDDMLLPEELFGQDADRIAAAVGFYQPDDWAWGRTFALVVTAPESPMRSARWTPDAAPGALGARR